LGAKLIDDARRDDEVVRIGERFGVARATLQAVCEAQAAAELSQVFQPSELEQECGVVRVVEPVVETRGEVVCARGRRDAFDVGREFCRFAQRVGGDEFSPAADECGRRGEREERVVLDGQERIDVCGVERGVELVCEEEVRSARRASRKDEGAAERESLCVLLEGETLECAAVVVEGVGVP
jgi:hypothetical protein